MSPRNFMRSLVLVWKFCKISDGRVGVGFFSLKMTKVVLKDENRYPLVVVQLEM